jgi:hypothetical protein
MIALKDATGQDFGEDLDKWRAWINEHFPYKK